MVIITEHYDESLIMLRRQLCWDAEDIVYLSLKVSCVVKQPSVWVDVVTATF